MKKDYGWTLRHPDGSLSMRFVRTTRQAVLDFFEDDRGIDTEVPDCCWATARKKGYRIVQVRLVEIC